MSQLSKVRYVLILAILLIAPTASYALAPPDYGSVTSGDAQDVVVDGVTSYFGSTAAIHNLTIKNGGKAYVFSSMIAGDVKLEGEGSHANFQGASIAGDVIVRDGGFLSAWYTTIGGNLLGQGFYHINFLVSDVGENIQLKNGGDFNAEFGPCNVGGNVHITRCGAVKMNWFTVVGNVQVSKCVSTIANAEIAITNSAIDGKLAVFSNEMDQGILVEGNAIGGNLSTRDNTPSATVIDNDVAGKKTVK